MLSAATTQSLLDPSGPKGLLRLFQGGDHFYASTLLVVHRRGRVSVHTMLFSEWFCSQGLTGPACICSAFHHTDVYGTRSTTHNPQLGDLFAGIGHGGGFFEPRRVPFSAPICKATQKTLTLYRLLLLVKCRNVSMQRSHIRHFTTIGSSTSSSCCLASQSRCTESQCRFYATRTRNHESPIQHRS